MAWRFVEHPFITRRTYVCDSAQATDDPGRPAAVPDTWVFSAYDPEDGEPACWVQPEHEARLAADGYCAMVPE